MFVRVKEHADLRREGLTIHSDASVSFVDAILGELVCAMHLLPACMHDAVPAQYVSINLV